MLIKRIKTYLTQLLGLFAVVDISLKSTIGKWVENRVTLFPAMCEIDISIQSINTIKISSYSVTHYISFGL